MMHNTIRRRYLMGAAITSFVIVTPWRTGRAETMIAASPGEMVEHLDDALLAAMKAGGHTRFDERYRALTPVIEQVFNLDAILAASVGRSWTEMPGAQKSELQAVFRRYIISSYVSNFDNYNGESFEVLPSERTFGSDEVVVETRLLSSGTSATKLDYVMRHYPGGWQSIDVLTDGSISRVATQRSDFRKLLAAGGVPALAAGLGRKVASLSGGLMG